MLHTIIRIRLIVHTAHALSPVSMPRVRKKIQNLCRKICLPVFSG